MAGKIRTIMGIIVPVASLCWEIWKVAGVLAAVVNVIEVLEATNFKPVRQTFVFILVDGGPEIFDLVVGNVAGPVQAIICLLEQIFSIGWGEYETALIVANKVEMERGKGSHVSYGVIATTYNCIIVATFLVRPNLA